MLNKARSSEAEKPNQMIIIVVLLIVVLSGGFFGGIKYQQTKTPSFAAGQFGNRGGFGGPAGASRGRMGGGQTVGEILTADDKSITVKLADGSSKIILLSSTVTINKASEGTKTDLTAGTRVAIFGQTNSDGSITAQNIQINPIARMPSGSVSPSPSK